MSARILPHHVRVSIPDRRHVHLPNGRLLHVSAVDPLALRATTHSGFDGRQVLTADLLDQLAADDIYLGRSAHGDWEGR